MGPGGVAFVDRLAGYMSRVDRLGVDLYTLSLYHNGLYSCDLYIRTEANAGFRYFKRTHYFGVVYASVDRYIPQ